MTGLGNPNPILPGVRATPGYEPAPNSEPLGANTGAPPRTLLYSRPVAPAAAGAPPTLIVSATPENRVAIITAPDVGFNVFIGNSGVTPATGLALTPGLNYEVVLPGLQELFAVTDSPTFLRVQIQVAAILLAERQRATSGL